MKTILLNWKLIILLCLSIGLAPFLPEPHVWGKLKWIAGGAHGMQPLDWFDFLLHSFPWWWLLGYFIYTVSGKSK